MLKSFKGINLEYFYTKDTIFVKKIQVLVFLSEIYSCIHACIHWTEVSQASVILCEKGEQSVGLTRSVTIMWNLTEMNSNCSKNHFECNYVQNNSCFKAAS